METVKSVNGVTIRLTEERWVHIIENHDDMAGYLDTVLEAVENPDYVIKGYGDAKIVLKKIETGKFVAVVYKETSVNDGFVITAYFTTKLRLDREVILWQKQQ